MDDILEQGRKLAESYHSEAGGGFINANRLNAYECDGERSFGDGPDKPGCGHYIVTIDRHPGVTPFMVRCGNCGMMAHSKNYKVHSGLKPTHEWYRPETLDGIPEHSHDHLSRGGLILRPISGAGWNRPADLNIKALYGEQLEVARRAMVEEMEALEKIKTLPTRQQRRHATRKIGRDDAPAEIQMYGATYRKVAP